MSIPPIVFDGAAVYRAGACNIGEAEIARRRTFGQIGLAAGSPWP